MSSSSGSMYKIEKKDKRLFVNAGASFRGLFTRRSKRSKKKDQASADEVSCIWLTVDGHRIIYIIFGFCLSSSLFIQNPDQYHCSAMWADNHDPATALADAIQSIQHSVFSPETNKVTSFSFTLNTIARCVMLVDSTWRVILICGW